MRDHKNKKSIFFHSMCVAVVLLTLICLVNVLQAQTPSPTPVDPGPRPTGNEIRTVSGAVCPIPSVKFPETACLDFAQPPSPNVPADGAGNIVANRGNLGNTWFEALTVFSTKASVNGTDDSGNTGQFIQGLGPSFNAESCFQCQLQHLSLHGLARGPDALPALTVSCVALSCGACLKQRIEYGFQRSNRNEN